jgi:hypothetical protein
MPKISIWRIEFSCRSSFIFLGKKEKYEMTFNILPERKHPNTGHPCSDLSRGVNNLHNTKKNIIVPHFSKAEVLAKINRSLSSS